MYKIVFEDSSSDSGKELRAIERRRALEAERKKRIFDSKTRKIGIDVNALDKQVEEKKLRKQNEINENLKWDKLKKEQDEVFRRMDSAVSKCRRRQFDDVNEYRRLCQNYQNRKNLNRNHPQFMDTPSLSSLEFIEDILSLDNLKKSQQEELKGWLDQQVKEQEELKKKLSEMEQRCLADSIKASKQWLDLIEMEKEHRRRLEETTDQFNKLLVQEKKHKKNEQVDSESNYSSITFGDNSTNLLGPNRIRRDHFKGFTKDQLKSIRQDQLKQIHEKETLKRNKKAANKKEDEEKQISYRSHCYEVEQSDKEIRQFLKYLSDENRKTECKLKSENMARFFKDDKYCAVHNKFNSSSR